MLFDALKKGKTREKKGGFRLIENTQRLSQFCSPKPWHLGWVFSPFFSFRALGDYFFSFFWAETVVRAWW